MDLVMTGYAGLTESVRLLREHREKLFQTLPACFLRPLSGVPEGSEGIPEWNRRGVLREPIGRGGVFAALWNLAERADTGICVSLSRIPVRQETIEICEILDLNPYQLPGGGWLYLTENGGFGPGVCIGQTRPGRARVVESRAGVRYLERPRYFNRKEQENA